MDRPEIEKRVKAIIGDARSTAYADGEAGTIKYRIGNMDFEKAIDALIPSEEVIDGLRTGLIELEKKQEDREDDLIEAKKQERERIRVWGNEDCTHHTLTRNPDKSSHPKFQCDICWQALKGE